MKNLLKKFALCLIVMFSIGVFAACGSNKNDNSTPSNPGTNPGTNSSYTLSISANNASFGTTVGSGSYSSGEVITITAMANPGYFFGYWSDKNTEKTRQITVSQNLTLQAIFFKGDFGESMEVNNKMVTVANGSLKSKYGFLTISTTQTDFSYWWETDVNVPIKLSKSFDIKESTINQDTLYTAQIDGRCGVAVGITNSLSNNANIYQPTKFNNLKTSHFNPYCYHHIGGYVSFTEKATNYYETTLNAKNNYFLVIYYLVATPNGTMYVQGQENVGLDPTLITISPNYKYKQQDKITLKINLNYT